MTLWRSLLLVYPEIDVWLPGFLRFPKRFAHRLPTREQRETMDSCKCFPALVSDLSSGAARVECNLIASECPLSMLA